MEPDVIILDIAMVLLNGIDAADQIHRRIPKAALILLDSERKRLRRRFRIGASG
jgi:DNA-binding NarL/FixJ family response regulator